MICGICPISLKDTCRVDCLDNLFVLAKDKAIKDYMN